MAISAMKDVYYAATVKDISPNIETCAFDNPSLSTSSTRARASSLSENPLTVPVNVDTQPREVDL